MFSVFGAFGQTLYNMADSRKAASPEPTPDTKPKSWLESKWSPVKVLSDEEYENMLREKLLRVSAQIALVDESIEALRQERAVAKDSKLSAASSSK